MSNDPSVTPGPYGPPPVGAPLAPQLLRRTSWLAVASLITACVAFFFAFVAGPFALPFSIGAIVVAILARKEIARDPNLDGNGMAIAGLVLGIAGVIFAILVVALFGALIFLSESYSS